MNVEEQILYEVLMEKAASTLEVTAVGFTKYYPEHIFTTEQVVQLLETCARRIRARGGL